VQRLTLDLGTITRPLIFFGGPCGNLEAVITLIAEADRRGVPGDHMICTGDIAAYCFDAQTTTDLLRTHGLVIVARSVEESLSAGFGNCGCEFNEGSACDVLASSWYAHADPTIDKVTKRWMGSLPHTATFTMFGAHLAVYGGVTQTNKFIFPTTADEDLRRELQLSGTDGVIPDIREYRTVGKSMANCGITLERSACLQMMGRRASGTALQPPALTLFVSKFRRWNIIGAALWPKFAPPDCPSPTPMSLKPGYGPATKLRRPMTRHSVDVPLQNRQYNGQRGA